MMMRCVGSIARIQGTRKVVSATAPGLTIVSNAPHAFAGAIFGEGRLGSCGRVLGICVCTNACQATGSFGLHIRTIGGCEATKRGDFGTSVFET